MSDSPTIAMSDFEAWGRQMYAARKQAADADTFDYDDYTTTLTSEEQAVVDEITNTDGVTLLGVGAARVALSVPDTTEGTIVLKLARYGRDETYDGKAQNEYEARLWATLDANDVDENVLPIHDSGDDAAWVTQPEVTPLDDADMSQSDADDLAADLRDDLMPLGNHLDIVEVTRNNVGLWNGEAYLFDYGIPP